MRYLFIIFVVLIACKSEEEKSVDRNSFTEVGGVTSLLGKSLKPLEESATTTHKKDSLLLVAKENFEKDPEDLDNIIWYGRRTAYKYHYEDAINIFTKGIEKHPNSAELFRHRGHRYISIREFDKAIDDLKRAAELAKDRELEIEPDGLPNKLNIPLSNLHFNIYYHLGLAHYLKGDFDKAAYVYDMCMHYSVNPDLITATADWQYMTYRRMGNAEKAKTLLEMITDDMEIIENESYFKRLLMYKGINSAEDLLDLSNSDEDAQLDIVTQGYGVGNWYLYNGDKEKALEIFNKILECDYWPAFGYIAAEAEVARGTPN